MDINVRNAMIVLKKYLENTNREKFEHSIRVAETCKILAERWNAPIIDAVVIGLLHDTGKCMSRRQMLNFCSERKMTMYEFEIFDNVSALHGKVSSTIFKKEFAKGNDKKRCKTISHAIEYHIAGGEKANMLDKIIFIADNIEPARGNNLLQEIKNGNLSDPDECIRLIINNKIEKSNEKIRQYNPFLDVTLSSLEER